MLGSLSQCNTHSTLQFIPCSAHWRPSIRLVGAILICSSKLHSQTSWCGLLQPPVLTNSPGSWSLPLPWSRPADHYAYHAGASPWRIPHLSCHSSWHAPYPWCTDSWQSHPGRLPACHLGRADRLFHTALWIFCKCLLGAHQAVTTLASTTCSWVGFLNGLLYCCSPLLYYFTF